MAEESKEESVWFVFRLHSIGLYEVFNLPLNLIHEWKQ